MKLYKILFENNDQEVTRPARFASKETPAPVVRSSAEENLISALLPMIASAKSETNKFFQPFVTQVGPFKVAEDFVKQNKKALQRIMSGSKTIKYLGSGSMGDAFDLEGKILKIEIEHGRQKISSGVRALKAAKTLWSKDPQLGSCMPMIYDQGILSYEGQMFNWILMEKFEPISGQDHELVNDLIFDIIDLKKISDSDREAKIEELGSKLQLSDNWYEKLKACMSALTGIDIKDFHSGNVGVRKTTGTLVFFD